MVATASPARRSRRGRRSSDRLLHGSVGEAEQRVEHVEPERQAACSEVSIVLKLCRARALLTEESTPMQHVSLSAQRLRKWRLEVAAASSAAVVARLVVELLDSFKLTVNLSDEAHQAVESARLELRRGTRSQNRGTVTEPELEAALDWLHESYNDTPAALERQRCAHALPPLHSRAAMCHVTAAQL
jgi:hypothetical protein